MEKDNGFIHATAEKDYGYRPAADEKDNGFVSADDGGSMIRARRPLEPDARSTRIEP